MRFDERGAHQSRRDSPALKGAGPVWLWRIHSTEKPTKESFQRSHRRLHADAETFYWDSLAFYGCLATGGPPNIIGEALGETLHDHTRDVLDHAPAKLRSSAGKLDILSHLHARSTS